MTASVGWSIFGSGRSSTRTSPGACSTAPRMVFLSLWAGPGRGISAGPGTAPRSGRRRCGRSVAAEYPLGDGHRTHGLRPAGVEGQVGDRLDELFLRGAVLLGQAQVEDQLLGVPAGGQGGDRDQAALLRRQLRARPRLAEEHVVGEVHQRGREVAEHPLGARGLLVLRPVLGHVGVLSRVDRRPARPWSATLTVPRTGAGGTPRVLSPAEASGSVDGLPDDFPTGGRWSGAVGARRRRAGGATDSGADGDG